MLPVYFRSGPWLSTFFPSLEWKIATSARQVYLTFDDGPHPEHTPWVLDQLDAYDCKATFFCIGNNVKKYPEVYREIIRRGHAVGNHTFNHVNGFKLSSEAYAEDIRECAEWVDSSLFRPPYGRINRRQIKRLSPHYRIVMWSVLSGDFDMNLNRELSLKIMKKNLQPGSILVFHDSEKAASNLQFLLPRLLQYMQQIDMKSAAL